MKVGLKMIKEELVPIKYKCGHVEETAIAYTTNRNKQIVMDVKGKRFVCRKCRMKELM